MMYNVIVHVYRFTIFIYWLFLDFSGVGIIVRVRIWALICIDSFTFEVYTADMLSVGAAVPP